MFDNELRSIMLAYESWIVRLYVSGRFWILRRFLHKIGQYLPREGRVLDVGCGFGLFSLYYALTHPGIEVHGFDVNPTRVAMAARAAARLGLNNVTYETRDARDFVAAKQFDAIYMLDIIHHLPFAAVRPLLDNLAAVLVPGGYLIVKDVDTRPWYKCAFTFLLDMLMDPRGRVHYWEASRLQATIEVHGFQVRRHTLVDYLPYPHVLYVCRRQAAPLPRHDEQAGPRLPARP